MQAAKRKLLTLAFVVDRQSKPNRILLGRKKTGFGKGYYNGFGGKVEVGETVVQGALRELKEETTLTVKDLTPAGVILFDFEDPPLVPMQVHVFVATQFDGKPAETSEMVPQWFDVDKIPFDKMWQDDPLWFPSMLGGKPFVGKFLFKQTHVMATQNITHVEADALPPMPPVDSETHSRHTPPANAEEAAAAGKWYEQKDASGKSIPSGDSSRPGSQTAEESETQNASAASTLEAPSDGTPESDDVGEAGAKAP